MQLVRQELLGTRVFVFTESEGSTRILNLARGATLGDAAQLMGASLVTAVPLISGKPAALTTELSNGEIVSFIPRGDFDIGRPSGRGRGAGVGGLTTAYTVEEGDEAGRQRLDQEQMADAAAGAQRWTVCQRCLPLPGDALVCTTSADSGGGQQQGEDGVETPLSLTLHRANCECLDLRRELAAGERLIRPTPALTEQYREKLDAALRPFHPDGSGSARRDVYTTKVIVFTTDRPGLLLAISAVVTEQTVNILDVHSKTWEVGLGSAFQYKVLITDVAMLERLTAALEALDDVVRVVRGDMEDMMHDLGPQVRTGC